MNHSIEIRHLELTQDPEDYDDIFYTLDKHSYEVSIRDAEYISRVFCDELVNGAQNKISIMITHDFSRGMIHEILFTPMRVAWSMDKSLDIIVADSCENPNVVIEHVKLVRDVCGRPISKA